MTPQLDPKLVREHFHAAVDLPYEARCRYLDKECPDPVYRRRVERLVAADEAIRRREATVLYTPPGEGSAHPTSDPRPKRDDPSSGDPFPSLPFDLPGYEVLERLGRGGMGFVYKVRDKHLRRTVALKCLPKGVTNSQWLERFYSEARTASNFNHPNICTIFDLEEFDGRPFIVMEFIEGHDFSRLVEDRWPVAKVAPLFAQAARALKKAHEAGIIHRDIKPSNIRLNTDGYVKVLDFGLARPFRLPESETPPGARPEAGTPEYMSPEQTRGDHLAGATDIFSLGVTLYELVTGRRPFVAVTQGELFQAIRSEPVVPASQRNPDIPAALDALLLSMLNKDARLRPTAEEVVQALEQVATSTPVGSGSPPRHTVGRHKDLKVLRTALDSATAGRGSFVCVAGEPGLGKTTLVEDFLAGLADGKACRIARGQCSERSAGTDPYLPFFEAMESLCRGPNREAALKSLKNTATTWYVHLVSPPDDPNLPRLKDEAKTASPDRPKRDLVAFCQELSGLLPMVLFIDDLHWADTSSINLLDYLGRNIGSMRVLIVLTYRPTEMQLAKHNFLQVQRDLTGRNLCEEIPLGFLTQPDIEQYLALEFPGHRFPSEMVDLLLARTEGNALFLTDLLRFMRDREILVPAAGGWITSRPLEDLEGELPKSIQSVIESKLELVEEKDRRLLEAASIQGQEFDSAVTARVLEWGAAEVEDRLAVLDRVHTLVRPTREVDLPDETPSVRYAFVHILYQNSLYSDLGRTQKRTWNAATAQSLLGFYGARSNEVATELAFLFEKAGDRGQAAEHFQTAARKAAEVFAYHESEALANRGLSQLLSLPDSTERDSRELPLQSLLGTALQATQGYSASSTGQVWERTRELCQRLGQRHFQPLFGLWLFQMTGSQYLLARELAEDLLRLALEGDDEVRQIVGHLAMESTASSQGELGLAIKHFHATLALLDLPHHRSAILIYGTEELRTVAFAFAAYALWPLGYPDQALGHGRLALSRAREVSHPYSLCLALSITAGAHLRRGEPEAALDLIGEQVAVAKEYHFPHWLGTGHALRGLARIQQANRGGPIELRRQGMKVLKKAVGGFGKSLSLSGLVPALLEEGRFEEARAIIEEARDLNELKGDRLSESTLARLQGEMLVKQGVAPSDAEHWFLRSVEVAQRQQAKSLELKAVIGLSRLYQQQGRKSEAHALLSLTYDWFTEGFGTADLQEAKTLLKDLA